MADDTKEKTKGTMEETKGKLKQAGGDLADNPEMRMEGKRDEKLGEARQTEAELEKRREK